jgi:murein DD-endopeptidase MepM/ murein hydrolase activator NlpD
MRRTRRRLIASTITAVLVALTAIAAPAMGDSYDDQRRNAEARSAQQAKRAEQLAASIEGLSAELGQAVLDLQATEARLPIARAELAAAKKELEASQREAVLIAARLVDAKAQETSITSTITADDARDATIRTAVGQMARRAYKGETAATGLSVVMDAKSTQDFVDQYGMISTALRTQTRALNELEQISATNRNGRARLVAVKDRVAELKVEADAKVVEADRARAAAAARQAEIVKLIAEQAAKKKLIASKRAQAQAEEARVDAERNAIARELAGIIARQRAAAAAAARAAGRIYQAPSGNLTGVLFANPTSVNPMYVTSEFGMRVNPVTGIYKLHAGIDLRAQCGTPIFAARAGTVLWAESSAALGNRVMINHGFVSGTLLASAYYHLTRYIVSPGQGVSRGQLIGFAGATGNANGCHLHFEVWKNGSPVNPRSSLGL